jgi:hypothetical protein
MNYPLTGPVAEPDLGGHPLFPRSMTDTGPDLRRFDLIEIRRRLPSGTWEICGKRYAGSKLRSWEQIIDAYGGGCIYQLVAYCGRTKRIQAWSEKMRFNSAPLKPFPGAAQTGEREVKPAPSPRSPAAPAPWPGHVPLPHGYGHPHAYPYPGPYGHEAAQGNSAEAVEMMRYVLEQSAGLTAALAARNARAPEPSLAAFMIEQNVKFNNALMEAVLRQRVAPPDDTGSSSTEAVLRALVSSMPRSMGRAA